MTDSHLDDELLSAHIDGEAPEAGAHVEGCPRCQARLADLRAAVALVAAPLPANPREDRERRVAAVLAAMDAPADASGGRPVSPRAPSALAPARPGQVSQDRRRLTVLAAAAAVVVLGLAAIPLLSGDDNSQNASDMASSQVGESRSDEVFDAQVVDGGDLGDQTDGISLGSQVRAVIEPAADSAAGALAGPPTTLASGGAAAAPAAGVSGGKAAVATTTTPASKTFGAPPAGGSARAALAQSPCAPVVRSEYGQGLGPLVFGATLRWQGRPAIALAYQLSASNGPLNHRIFVLAADDCQLLVVQGV